MWQSLKNIYHLVMAVLANIFYGFPSNKLTVIGVTGTDGKTTTVNLIYHILKEAGKNVSMISSVGASIDGEQYDIGLHVTTPSSWQLQRFLRRAARIERFVRQRQPYLVLEVTSHALDQYRVWGIDFAVGVLTNVTREHLDYHKNYENYVATKAKLLNMAKIAIINRDDESYKTIVNSKWLIANSNLITYGLANNSDVNPKSSTFKTKLVGEFNKYNILAAVAVCRALGIPDQTIKKAVISFELPVGRMEVVHDDEFMVMIDFAHTPNALIQILKTVRPEVKGRLIHVFGSAGERDRQKRPEMGTISAKYADVIILTAEDPRSENLDKIISEIETGIKKLEPLKIPDRQEAINTAVSMARKGDLVLITGKGHEKSMNLGKGEVFWSEHEAVRKAIN